MASNEWLVRKLHEQDKKIEALSRGGTGVGYSSIAPGENLTVISEDGEVVLGAGGVEHVDGPTPATPSAPTLKLGFGTIETTWDGSFAEGEDEDGVPLTAPVDFDVVEVHCSTDPEEEEWGEDTMRGQIKTREGGTVTVGGFDVDDEVFVCLIALAKTGKRSAPSATASLVIEGLDFAQLTNELDAATVTIDNAREVLLDGQNTLGEKLDAADTALSDLETTLGELDSTTLPALRQDLDVAEGRLDAAEGQITDAFGEIADARSDAQSYADGLKTQIDSTIDTARTELEGDITTAQARADAAFQDAAQAASDAAAARSHADDLVNSILDSGANIVPDGGFENPASWTAVRGSVIESATARSGGRVLKMAPLNESSYFYSREIPASPGRVWYVEVWVRRVVDAATDSVRIYARHYAADGSFTSGYASDTPGGPVLSVPGDSLPLGEWTLIKGYVTAPSGVVRTSLGGWVAAQTADYEYDDIRAVDVTVAAQALADAEAAQSAADQAKATADAAQSAASSAQSTATQALTSANAKNKVTRSTSRPPAVYDGRVDDVWFTMSSMGSGGRVLFQEMWNGNTWVSVTIDSQVIAYLDAAKITTGYLNVGALIEAGAITADKILVGSGGNVIPWGQVTGGATLNPHQISGSSSNVSAALRPANVSKGLPAHAAVTRTDTGSHSNSISFWSAPSRRLPVDEGTEYVFTATVYSDTESTVRLTMAGYVEDGSGTANSTGVFASSPIVTVGPQPVVLTARGTVPAGSFYAIPFLRISGPSTVGFSMPDLRKSVGSTLIQDGAVTTGKLAANVLEVGNLKAGVAAIAEAVVQKIAASTASIQQADVKNLFVTGTSSLSNVVAERIAAETAKFIQLEVGNLVAGTGTMDTATVKKLFSDVVVASMAQAEQFIGENAILTGAVTAPKITASEELWAKIAEFVKIRAEHIEADAIDGMVITGATIRSAATGARTLMSASGFEAYDNTGKRTFFASASTGNVSMTGELYTGEPGSERVVLDNSLWKSVAVEDPETGSVYYTAGAGVRIGVDSAVGLDVYHAARVLADGRTVDMGMVRGPGGLSRTTYGSATAGGGFGAQNYVSMRALDSNRKLAGEVLVTSGGYGSLTRKSELVAYDTAENESATVRAIGSARTSELYVLDAAENYISGVKADGMARSAQLWACDDAGNLSIFVNADGEYGAAAVEGSGIRPFRVNYEGSGSNWLVPFQKNGADWGYVGSTGAMGVNDFGIQSAASKNLILTTTTGSAGIVAKTNGDVTFSDSKGVNFSNIPVSSGTGVNVTAGGWFQKNTSSLRYKTDVEPVDMSGFDVLSLEPKSFVYKDQKARFEKPRDEWGEYEEEIFANGLPTSYGLIAEEVEDAGGQFAVNYDQEGLPDSLNYGLIGVALIPTVRDLRDRITELERQLNE